jgi:hypothetical protein
MSEKYQSGRAIMLRLAAARKQEIIDCSLAMAPAWEAVLLDVAKDFPAMLAAINEKGPTAS